MPRDPGGLYFLPAGNPVVTGTIIESDWANPTMSDVGQEISDSLSRSGKGGMLAALRGLDGSAAVPTFSFTNEPATGRYRAGPGQVVESVDGTPVVRYLATGLEQWDSDILDWVPLTPRDAAGTPFDPNPTDLTSTNVQAAIEEVNSKTGGVLSAANVTYDDTNVYFPAATVQQAIDRLGADFAGLANDVLDNADAILVLDGELTLLTNRVTLNETNIGTNSVDIGVLQTSVANQSIDINNNQQDISVIKLEQIQQSSDINQNTASIDFTYNITQDNANAISQNAIDISTNATDIISVYSITQTNAGNISGNTADIATNLTYISANANNITTNTNNIAAQTGAIVDNANDIATLDARLDGYDSAFPGGVLQVVNGGTGVQASTGTGSTVRHTSPTFAGAPLVPTPVTSNRTAQAANTFWVNQYMIDSNFSEMYYGATGSGYYLWVAKEGIMYQWGSKAASGGVYVALPVAYSGTNYSIAATMRVATSAIQPYPLHVESYASNGFTIRTNHHFFWMTMGIYTG